MNDHSIADIEFRGNMVEFSDYLTGQRLFMRMHPLASCENEWQRDGWIAAAKWSADAETQAWLDARAVDEVQSEYTDWRM